MLPIILLILFGLHSNAQSSPNCYFLAESDIFSTYKGECCNAAAVSYMDKTFGPIWIFSFLLKPSYVVELTSKGLCSVSTTTRKPTTTTPLSCSWLTEPFYTIINSTIHVGPYEGTCCTQVAMNYLEEQKLTALLYVETYSIDRKWDLINNTLFCVKGACSEAYRKDCLTTPSPYTPPSTTPRLPCSWLRTHFSLPDVSYDGSCCTQVALDALEESNMTIALNYTSLEERWKLLSEYLFCVEGACSGPVWRNCSNPESTTTNYFSTTPPSNCSWLGEPFPASNGTGAYNGTCCTQVAVDAINDLNMKNFWNSSFSMKNKWMLISEYLFCIRGACDEELWDNCTVRTSTTTETTELRTMAGSSSSSTSSGRFTSSGSSSTFSSLSSSTSSSSSTSPGSSTTTTHSPTTSPPQNCSWLAEPFNASTTTPKHGAYLGTCCTQKSIDFIVENNFTSALFALKFSEYERWNILTKSLFCIEGACSEAVWGNCSGALETSTSSLTSSLSTLSSSRALGSSDSSSSSIAPSSLSSSSSYPSSSTSTFPSSLSSSTPYPSSPTSSPSSSTPLPPPLNCSWLREPFNASNESLPYQSYHGSCCSQVSLDALNEKNYTYLLFNSSYSTYGKWQLINRFLFCIKGACSEAYWTNCTNTLFTTPPPLNCSWLGEPFPENDLIGQYTGSCCSETSLAALNGSFFPDFLEKHNFSMSARWVTLSKYLYCIEGACLEPTPIWSNCTGGKEKENEKTSSSTLSSHSIEHSTSKEVESTTTSSEIKTTTSLKTKLITITPEAVTSINDQLETGNTTKATSSESSTSTPIKTTTFAWPTGGTTRLLPNGEIMLSESLISYPNCTTILMQLILNPSTNVTRTERMVDAEGCKTTTSSGSSAASATSTTPMTSSESPGTTTFPWPTGGTTRLLPSGEIILSESLISYPNCTTILYQLILNPSTNTTRTETTSDAQGCKATTTSAATGASESSTSSSTPIETTTFNWPTGGTTRLLPSGEIILSESLISHPNCTTILYQLILNPSKNTTRTETMSDPNGCKATSSKPSDELIVSTSSNSPETTTFPWPTGGTTRLLPSGEIILSESLISYPNCTTILYQLILNPSTNVTRTETISDAEGCKTTTTSSGASGAPKASPSSTSEPIETTTFPWPTGGTTRLLPSGEIMLSESLISYPNCTTILYQLILNPTTNTTRTEITSDAEGCKATSSEASGATSTPTPIETTTFNWPTGGTTRLLPSGEIMLAESLISYPNCTTVLHQLILNPTTNTTRTETMSDAQGCKATTTSSGASESSESTEQPFTFPESLTTRLLPSGEILLSESLITYKNCTTVLMQLILNPKTNTTRTERMVDTEGCKATTTPLPTTTTTIPSTNSTTCPTLSLDLSHTNRPTSSELTSSHRIGARVEHVCEHQYVFHVARQPFKVFVCQADGTWNGQPESCVVDKVEL